MTTIIKNKESNEEFILLGTGFGATDYGGKERIDSTGNEKERYPLLCVCNAKGRVGWVYSEEFIVVQIDGQTPAEIYAPRIQTVSGS
ncbi:MAG: hypothetical protein ACI9EW_002910 [Cellvibrionaceae bacterium]|jgi:hypothetical protein